MSFSGAVGEGGHHVASALSHCPAVLLGRALEPALGSVRVEREHLFQVLEHVVKESPSEALAMDLSPVPVHGLLVGLEVAVKVSLLVGLMLGVKVVLVVLVVVVAEVFENVIKVKRLEVLSEVIVASVTTPSSSSVTVPWRWAMAKLVILLSPLVIRQRLIGWKKTYF